MFGCKHRFYEIYFYRYYLYFLTQCHIHILPMLSFLPMLSSMHHNVDVAVGVKGLLGYSPSPIMFNVVADMLDIVIVKSKEDGSVRGLTPHLVNGGVSVLHYTTLLFLWNMV